VLAARIFQACYTSYQAGDAIPFAPCSRFDLFFLSKVYWPSLNLCECVVSVPKLSKRSFGSLISCQVSIPSKLVYSLSLPTFPELPPSSLFPNRAAAHVGSAASSALHAGEGVVASSTRGWRRRRACSSARYPAMRTTEGEAEPERGLIEDEDDGAPPTILRIATLSLMRM